MALSLVTPGEISAAHGAPKKWHLVFCKKRNLCSEAPTFWSFCQSKKKKYFFSSVRENFRESVDSIGVLGVFCWPFARMPVTTRITIKPLFATAFPGNLCRPSFCRPSLAPFGIRTTLMSDCWYKGCNINTWLPTQPGQGGENTWSFTGWISDTKKSPILKIIEAENSDLKKSGASRWPSWNWCVYWLEKTVVLRRLGSCIKKKEKRGFFILHGCNAATATTKFPVFRWVLECLQENLLFFLCVLTGNI